MRLVVVDAVAPGDSPATAPGGNWDWASTCCLVGLGMSEVLEGDFMGCAYKSPLGADQLQLAGLALIA